MELLDDHLERVRHKDEFFFERKQKESSGKAPVTSINFNHNEDNINGVFEVDYAALSEQWEKRGDLEDKHEETQ